MKDYVFVYGSLKQGYWNNGLLARAKFIGKAVSVSDSFSLYDGSFPYALSEGVSRLGGEIFEVEDEETIRNLDRLEGVPNHYVRKEAEFIIEEDEPVVPGLENQVTAFLYVAAPNTAARIKESRKGNRLSPNNDNVVSWR